jgi:hypothetical protein
MLKKSIQKLHIDDLQLDVQIICLENTKTVWVQLQFISFFKYMKNFNSGFL